ncbi:hypothetical protein FGG08_006275 [Glutinoglossum americanum]|uniref:Uncharacterized protein n=1 Tax=Glutinoglossum americanum TaxID=1670608 RepID=A0A9P8L115_9PEZI|nr:hypothetical protein FGG08_006275 [Glutinoglossum americanum]
MLNASGYSCSIGDYAPYICTSTVLPPLSVPFWNASSLSGRYHFVSSTAATQTRVVAIAVVVKYKPEDVTLFPGSVATTLVGSPAAQPTITTITQTTTSTTPSPSTATGTTMSPGIKIAIGVAVPIAVLSLIAVIATILFFRRRNRRPTAPMPAAPAPVIQYVIAPPMPPPQGPPPQGKPTYYYQPPASPPQGPPVSPGYHEMAHGQGLEYQIIREDEVRS